MGLSSRLLRLPKPQTFLYTMSLSTGASLITLSLLLNKLSGVYGILALLTGFHLSPLQFSMYLYSIAAMAITIWLTPHIKTQSPFHCLALAWFYVLDSVVNAAYTAVFAVTWFLVLAQHSAGKEGAKTGPGAGTIDDTAGFTDPKLNVSKVDIIASPNSNVVSGQDAVAAATPAGTAAGTESSVKDIVLGIDSINSIGVIVTLWTIRLYFCLVMLAWARMVIRQHIAVTSVRNGTYSSTAEKGLADDPFADTKPEGQGWKGKLGRFMVAILRNYWLGTDSSDEESWMQGMGSKFRKTGAGVNATGNAVLLNKIEGSSGPTERERRRRSGTGPPLPEVQAAAVGAEDDAETAGLLKVPNP